MFHLQKNTHQITQSLRGEKGAFFERIFDKPQSLGP